MNVTRKSYSKNEGKSQILGNSLIMRWWTNYANLIKRNCETEPLAIRDMRYWRNNLFAGTLIYMFPFSLITLIPGIYWNISTDNFLLVLVDIAVLLLIAVLAFLPSININTRKSIFIIIVYVLGCVLIYVVGLHGPGLIYLQAAGIFSVLIFHVRYSYWPAIANFCICVAIAFAIPLGWLSWDEDLSNSLGSWIAVSSNLVFLSLLSSTLIPRLFIGLQNTILVEEQLRTQLNADQEALRKSVLLLEQKNTELEQFAYIASHDLQEPLRMITSFLNQIEKKYDPLLDDRGRKYIFYAVDGAQRMRQIILDLLEYSRAGHSNEMIVSIDLNLLVRDILIFFEKQIEESNSKVVVQNLPIIRAYTAPLRQLFQNLIDNGLKYAKEGRPPEILISSIEREHLWEFIISDNGIGISEEYFDRIFIIFKRLHTHEHYTGTGIGLALCKKIVESLGGEIWLDSKVGIGSTFHFTIKKNFLE